jgi:hypothetical protein
LLERPGDLTPGRQYGTTSNDHPEYKDSYPPASISHYTFPERSKKYPAVKLHWCGGGMQPERLVELEADRRPPTSGTIFVGEKGKFICEAYPGDSPLHS